MNNFFEIDNRGYINPCIELMDILEDDMKSSKQNENKEREEKRRNLVEHLQTVGWKINHEWLDKISKKSDPNEEDILRRTIWGLYDGDYHLITKCQKFTVRIRKRNAVFWRKNPEWKELIEIPLEEKQFTDRGIKYEDIIEIATN